MRGNLIVERKRLGKGRFLKRFLLILGILLVLLAIFSYLVYKRIILLNHPSNDKYPVRGIDISSYQGEVNWDVIEKQDINFAYIKATEGSSFVDPEWKDNCMNAKKTNIKVGAYHFFSFDSSGDTQADNFIKNVVKDDDMLPPAIDVEFYGSDKKKSKDEVLPQLDSMSKKLEEHYGKKPVFYATMTAYYEYLKGEVDGDRLWIRSVYSNPKYLGVGDWKFWQFTDSAKLDGYDGKEDYIDVNIFNGTLDELDNY